MPLPVAVPVIENGTVTVWLLANDNSKVTVIVPVSPTLLCEETVKLTVGITVTACKADTVPPHPPVTV